MKYLKKRYTSTASLWDWYLNCQNGLLNLKFFPSIRQEAHITLMTKILAYQPEPIWPSIIQSLLSHGMKVSKLIILNFGAFVPG